jgi:hypothetical protein
VLIDANLAWRASALTTLLFTVELYRFDRRRLLRWAARQLGFEVRHVFWRRLIGIPRRLTRMSM